LVLQDLMSHPLAIMVGCAPMLPDHPPNLFAFPPQNFLTQIQAFITLGTVGTLFKRLLGRLQMVKYPLLLLLCICFGVLVFLGEGPGFSEPPLFEGTSVGSRALRRILRGRLWRMRNGRQSLQSPIKKSW
jgi:hypothetical protein